MSFGAMLRDKPYGDTLSPAAFAALKADLQQRFDHLGSRWGGGETLGCWRICRYCGEERPYWHGNQTWIGVRGNRMCWKCFENGVLFQDDEADFEKNVKRVSSARP